MGWTEYDEARDELAGAIAKMLALRIKKMRGQPKEAIERRLAEDICVMLADAALVAMLFLDPSETPDPSEVATTLQAASAFYVKQTGA